MITHKYGVEYPITFRKVSIEDSEILKDFDCGNPSINDFIQRKCLNEKGKVTYIFLDTENNQVICFCSICCTGISINAMYGSRRCTTSIPSIEIDFFAVDERYRSIPFDEESNRYETLSNTLFSFIIEKIEEIAEEHVGATRICLYSVPQAVSFYKRSGFKDFEEYMNADDKPYIDGCIPLFLTIA